MGIVWVEAHGDFNAEATTPSGYLRGMPLALAVGVGALTLTLPLEMKLRPVPASRVVLVGARDIDHDERVLLDRSSIERRGLDLRDTERVSAVGLAATWHHNGRAASPQRALKRRISEAAVG